MPRTANAVARPLRPLEHDCRYFALGPRRLGRGFCNPTNGASSDGNVTDTPTDG